MKKIILLINLVLLMNTNCLLAQNTLCDSIEVDSVYVDNNMLFISVYNTSQHFIVYPILLFN